MPHWDKRFLDLAAHIAEWSKDPSTKVGALVVDSLRRIVATGYNGFPRGVHDDQQRYATKRTKYGMIVHAEANCVLNSIGSLMGCTMYTLMVPCSECTKLIVQSGITRVVFLRYPHAQWVQDAEVSRLMMFEAGVQLQSLRDIEEQS